MKFFLSVLLLSFVFSSTYDVQIKMDDYQGIRQGSTTVSYNGENAGKVKRIAEDDKGGYLVTLKIYDTFEINGDMLFKVENRKLVVDLDGMEKRKINKEKKKQEKLKAAEEEKARQLKAVEEEKARQLKAVEEEKARQLKVAEEEKARQLKVAEEEKARQLKTAEEEKKARQLKAAEEEKKARQLKAAEEEKTRQLKAAEDKKNTKKEKVETAPVMVDVKDDKVAKEESSKTKKLTDRELLKEQYDTAPKLKRRLKISAKKYKDNDPVTLKFLINKKGYVEEVSIKNSSGNSKFDAAAKKAIKKSKWHPAKKHDISVAAWHELEISF